MQRMTYRKHLGLSLTFALAATVITPSASAFFPCDRKDAKKVIGTTVLVAAITTFVRLVTKKTQPKRVYPKDDSFSEVGWYIFDELLTGQMEKGERANKVTFDPENPTEFTIQYSKIEARGLAGTLYSTLKPVIIPALTFMLLLNEDIIGKSAKGIHSMIKFIHNPTQPYDDFMTIVDKGELPKPTNSSNLTNRL